MSNFDSSPFGVPFEKGSPFEKDGDRREREAFAATEAAVRAAALYVRPSENLRPATLEAARRLRGSKHWRFRLAVAASLITVLAATNIPGRFAADPNKPTLAQQTVQQEYELQQQSAKNLGITFNPGWAWVEAFFELRNKQAEMIND